MTRNRVFRFFSWNVRGLNDPAKCTIVRSFIRNSKCSVLCLQETKLSSISFSKFLTFCAYHLQDFRFFDATGTKGGLLIAWNPSLFECVEEWSHSFAFTLALRRMSDGRRFLISNVYGPTCASSRPEFFRHLNYLGHLSRGAWVIIGDFNILLYAFDKNGPFSITNDTFLFRELVRDLSLYDVPLLNKSYTWTNGRWNPTLERLDRVFISQDWTVSFPRNCLRALPQPRSDHAPLVLTAHTFLLKADLFRFETF